jgi:nucleoid DNA-binding protein
MTPETSRHQVAEIVRMALDAGKTVEIEGLGTFQVAAQDQGYQFEPQTAPEVFLAYVVEDLVPARRLCEALRAEGFSPWLDKDKLLPGQNWPRAIERAIEISDAFVACFSTRSIVKRGQFQSELRYALDCARQRPLDQTFVIPVRLEECSVPRRISSHVHYVDLYPDWHKGVRRIARAIRKAARGRPVAGLALD